MPSGQSHTKWFSRVKENFERTMEIWFEYSSAF